MRSWRYSLTASRSSGHTVPELFMSSRNSSIMAIYEYRDTGMSLWPCCYFVECAKTNVENRRLPLDTEKMVRQIWPRLDKERTGTLIWILIHNNSYEMHCFRIPDEWFLQKLERRGNLAHVQLCVLYWKGQPLRLLMAFCLIQRERGDSLCCVTMGRTKKEIKKKN